MEFKEVAVSLNFKMYRDRPGVVVDYRTKQEYPKDAIDTHILVYEDRVKGWFLNYGHMLQGHMMQDSLCFKSRLRKSRVSNNIGAVSRAKENPRGFSATA